MLTYVIRRFLTAIPTLFVIVTLAFFLIRVAPGGPFNQERGLSPEIKANLEKQFGLDEPLWQQYLNYLNNLLHGNFGPSYNLPDFTVGELFAKGLPISVQLGASALFLALIVGGALGIVAALKQNRLGDYLVIAIATAGSTIPTFVIAPVIQLLFGLTWKLLPIGGWGDGALLNKIGPILTLSLPQIAIVARLMRGSMIEFATQPPYPYGPRARPLRLVGGGAPCAARRGPADRLLCRPSGGRFAHRLGHRRDDIFHPRRRALFRRRRAQPRLHAGDGNGGGDRPVHDHLQSHRRYSLRVRRSEGPL